MASPNADPIYSRAGDVSSNGTTGMNPTLTTAANDYTGISANNKLVFTADATNGSFVQRLRFKAIGTNTASVARIYINNGSTNTTATNNSFYGELALPATTAIATTSTIDIDYPLNFALNPGFTIYVGLGTTVAAGWVVTPIAGKY
jgi:hypothetical protein